MGALRSEYFVADHVTTLGEARDAVGVAQYDVILTERLLPDGDGLDWVRERRRAGSTAPILILSATLGTVEHRVEGLNAGADDYIPKPIPLDELVARIRAVLRRPASTLDLVLRAGNIAFDPATREVRVAGRPLRMPRRETCVLEMLIRRAGKTVTKNVLEEGLYSFEDDVSSNAIEVGIYRLRGHLQGAGATAKIRTLRGTGYVLEAEDDASDEVPNAVLLAAQVAVAMSSRHGAARTRIPVIAAGLVPAPKPEARVAILAAALALSMTQFAKAEGSAA
ncbi:response regulator transcription factor [Methylobacterium sp. J-076]|nr:response regulator transcription factor [Methylobacterium sp. J-076]